MALVPINLDAEGRSLGLTGQCHFCEAPSSVYWWQGRAFELCTNCALTCLPPLLADAAVFGVGPAKAKSRAQAALCRIEAAYWRAVAGLIGAEHSRREELRRQCDDENAG
jgi:hypothetical protein